MKIGGHPIDFMVDTGADHSIVTQPVDPFSQKHATVIRAMGNRAHCRFLVSRQCNLGSHEVKHKFLYLPNCPMALMGRDLLCKLRAQITFDPDCTATLKLRGPKARILTLHKKRNGSSMPLGEGLLRFLSFPSRFQAYRWKITPRTGPKRAPHSGGIKAWSQPHQPKTVLHSPEDPG
jgi:hypothetical protein